MPEPKKDGPQLTMWWACWLDDEGEVKRDEPFDTLEEAEAFVADVHAGLATDEQFYFVVRFDSAPYKIPV